MRVFFQGRDTDMHGLAVGTNTQSSEADRIIVIEDDYNEEMAPFTTRCAHIKHLNLTKDPRVRVYHAKGSPFHFLSSLPLSMALYEGREGTLCIET